MPDRSRRARTLATVAGVALTVIGAALWWQGRGVAGSTVEARLARVLAHGDNHRTELVTTLAELVAIPSVAADPAGLQAAADLLGRELEAVGFSVENLATRGPPVLLALQRDRPAGGGKTLLLYAHYDGQDADPSKWTHCAPFSPTYFAGAPAVETRLPSTAGPPTSDEHRMCGRGSADDKGPIAIVLQLLRDLAREQLGPTGSRIAILLDGAEESGSWNLDEALAAPDLAARIDADLVVSLDGPVFAGGQPTVTFGVRGIATVDLVTYGPSTDLHSGHYGNWAPNPVQELAHLLDGLKDPYTGEVRIAGFYDCREPLSPADQRALDAVPDLDAELRDRFALGKVETRHTLKEAITHPSLNLRGIAAADVGTGARTVVPSRAEAAIDIRLVRGCEGPAMIELLRRHLIGLGYRVVDEEPTLEQRRAEPRLARLHARPGGYAAVRTPTELPAAAAVVAAVERATGERALRIPTMGGSLPLHVLERRIGAPLVGLPLVNADNNQHGPDENVRLGHLFRGYAILATLLLVPR